MKIEDYCSFNESGANIKIDINKYRFNNIVTCNKNMLSQLELIRRISKSDATVVISGKTGTGKELYAEYIHQMSNRFRSNYIKVNCATISESLFESEMFGYTSGSFTGALKDGKKGLLEIANKGTLFLDEISEMPKSIQSKLLRVIQEKTFTRLGGANEVSADIRFIVASNKTLSSMVDEGEFREDLYYRLSVVPISLLPLIERKEDIILLIFFFLKRYNEKYCTDKRFSKSMIEVFLDYNWPGNVRELKHTVERMVLLTEADLIEEQEIFINSISYDQYRIKGMNKNILISDKSNGSKHIKSLKEQVKEFEIMLIREEIEKTGSLRKAAKSLQASPSSLSRKLNENN